VRTKCTDSVFILWHVREIDGGDEDEKLIGIYRTRADAEAAISRLSDKPGFRDWPSGFQIHEYVLGRDGWTEGFTPVSDPL
jgi:hypothetical protein